MGERTGKSHGNLGESEIKIKEATLEAMLFAVKVLVPKLYKNNHLERMVFMARRGENIYKRKDGRWEARYIKSRTLEGKAIYGYIYRDNYFEAKRAQAQARANCGNQTQKVKRHASPYKLGEYLDAWLRSVRTCIKASTFSNYCGLIHRHILPELSQIPMEQITCELIQDYVNQKLESGRLDGRGGLSVKTVRDIVGLLKHSLKPAGITLQINLPRYSPPKPRVLTPAEQKKLVIAAKKSGTMDGAGVLLSLFTGIRIGELCSLKWRNLDLENGILEIATTLQRIENWNGGYSKTVIDIGMPKSDSSMRKIPLPSFLGAHLAKLRGDAGDNDYILSGSDRFVEPRCCQQRFRKLINSVGIDTNFHALRHTFATRCIELDIDIKTISEILGHANVSITLNRYVHPDFEHRKECIEKLSVSF